MVQAQTEFEGTFRCTLVDVREAFHPDGRLHSLTAGTVTEKEVIPIFRNFTVNVGRNSQEIAGREWIVVQTAAMGKDFLAVRSLVNPLITLHVRTWMNTEEYRPFSLPPAKQPTFVLSMGEYILTGTCERLSSAPEPAPAPGITWGGR